MVFAKWASCEDNLVWVLVRATIQEGYKYEYLMLVYAMGGVLWITRNFPTKWYLQSVRYKELFPISSYIDTQTGAVMLFLNWASLSYSVLPVPWDRLMRQTNKQRNENLRYPEREREREREGVFVLVWKGEWENKSRHAQTNGIVKSV
jgi:hypothetical protein